MTSPRRSSGRAYARASARGVLLGLLISIAVVAPFAISAADPQSSPTPPATSQPQASSQPTNSPTPNATPSPNPTPEATDLPTVESTAQPTEQPTPYATPTAEPTADATPIAEPTAEPTAAASDIPTPQPTPSEAPSASPTTAPDGVGLILTFATGADFAARASSIALVGGTETGSIGALRMATVTVPVEVAVTAADALRGMAGVSRVETEHERTIESDPNDTHYSDQWALERIGWPAAYNAGAPSGSAIVAILDTGVNGAHPDLAGQLVDGATFTGDAPANTDPNGHGTAMAGIVAALVNNDEGVAGVAFAGVRIMPVTVLGADGTGTDGDIIAGIVWAVDHGADVISMSFSSPTYSPSLQAAIDYAWTHDVVLVAATGNDGSAGVTYPAADRGVMGVSNTDPGDALASSSNYGADAFLAAPGVGIETTNAGGDYTSLSGTSASAAMVAGAAGLLRAADMAASNGQVVYRLAATAADVAPVEQVGNGRLDLGAAYGLHSADAVQPAGAGVFGDGGPIVDPTYTAAATSTWTGTTSNDWNVAGNWSPSGIPAAGSDLVFPASASNKAMTNGISAGRSFNSISYSGNGYTLTGNAIIVAGSISDSATSGSNSIGIAFSTTAVRTVTVTDSTETLTISGIVSGALGGITKAGSGTLTLSGANSYSGATTMNAGTLNLNNATALGTGDFTMAGGTVVLNSAITAAGSWTNNGGTLTHNSNIVTFIGLSKTIGGTASTAFAGISITTGTITLNTNATATSLTFANSSATNSLTHGSGVDLTVNGNVTINQATGAASNHDWAINAGTATVTGSVTFAITASTAGRATRVLITTGALTVQGDVVMTNAFLAANSVIDMSGGAGTLNLLGALTVNTLGTLTPGTTSTVDYKGTIDQRVTASATVTYGTLKIDKASGTATLGADTTAVNVTLAQGTLSAGAGNFGLTVSGTWTNNGGTFSGGTSTVTFSGASGSITGTSSTAFPAVSVATGAAVTMNNSNTSSSLAFVASGTAQTLTQANGTTFSISGAVTLNQPSTNSVTSAWNINAATVSAGLITFAGANTTTTRIFKIVITSGTLNANAGITFAASAAATKVIDMSGGAGTLNLVGALTVPALSSTLTAGTSGSTFVYADTTAQTINLFSAGAYNNVSVSNSSSGGASLSTAISAANVTGNVRVLTGGRLDNGGFAIVGNAAKTFEIQDGATIRLGGTSAWPTTFGTFILGGASNSSTVEYYGGAQNIAATATIGSNYDILNMSGTTVTKTLLGDITIDKTLTVSSSATFAMSNKNVTAGSLAGDGTIATGNGAVTNTMTIGSDNTSTAFSGVINSANDAADSLVKNGSGTLTLSNTSTFTGTQKVSAGTLLVTGTLGATSTATIDGGTLAGNGTTGIVSGTSSGGTLGPGNPASSTGILSTKNFALAAQSTYSVQLNGTTAGTSYDQVSATGTVNLASATLSVSLGYTPTIGDSFTIVANDSADAVTGTFSGQAEGSTVTLNGVAMTVSYVGGTGNDVTLSVASKTETWTGASSSSWNNAGNWSEGRIPTAGDSLVFQSSPTSFTPNNDLAAATTFASVTVSGSGYAIFGNSITLGSSGLTASNSSGSNTISLNIVLPADRTVTVSNGSGTLVLSGVVSGSFNVTKAGSGTLIVSGANTYSNTTVSAGTLQVGNGGATGSVGSGSVTNNAALTFNRTDIWTVSNTISGSGTVTKNGSGTLTLSGSNSYQGATTIGAGTLSIGADNNLGTAPGSATSGQLTFSGGTLATTSTFTLNANRGIAFSSTGTIDVAASTVLTYNGIAAGSGTGLTKTSSGTLTLGGSNSYTGVTTVTGGTLKMGAVNALSSSTAVTVGTSGTFDLNGNNTTIGSLAGSGIVTLGAGTLSAGGDNTSTAFSGTVSGTGGLTKAGSGTFDLTNATTVSVGPLTINAGALTAPGSGKTFNVAGAWSNNSGAGAFTANGGTVTFNGSSSQAIGGSFATTFNSVTVSNSAGLSLSKVMTINGTLTLSSGNITTGSNNVYIASGATISRTSGHVVGNMRKYVPTGSSAVTFEIGDSGAYTPATVSFVTVSVAGDLTASTTSGDHPNISSSLINSAKSVNRYWTLTNSGITFTTYVGTFTFVAGDIDAGADTNAFFVDEYSSSTWVGPQISTRTSTSTSATGLTAFGDFIVGEGKVPAPTSVTATAISTRRIDMTWTDNSGSETGYEIQKGTDGVNYLAYTTTAANATAQSVTGLSANTTYYLRIRTVTASGNSPWVYTNATTLAVPAATADSYSTYQDVTLLTSAPGLLSNDPDGTNGFYTASKASDPSHGSVTVNSDGSFSYAPTSGFTGTDSFTYKVNDGGLQSSATTVTITVNTSAYVSASSWPTSANSSRYLQLNFPAYLPSSATVSGATFTHTYRSLNSSTTTCYYIEVYNGATLLATHGSSGSPISCNSTSGYATDQVSLPEINTAAKANAVRIRLIVWNSGAGQSEHRYANLSVNYHLD